MDVRDRARSDLYLAQLRSQSAPNTPGFGPLSPSAAYKTMGDIEEGYGEPEPGARFVEAKPGNKTPKPFALQPPPIRIHAATPKTSQAGFSTPPRAVSPPAETVNEHAPVAPGEQQYAAVPIPGAYVAPGSPGPQQQTFVFSELPGQAVTSEHRIESPPSSPRLGYTGLRR
jgi:hypothetical protein